MESIIVKTINGENIGALFVENREIYLIDIRKQMVEEIDEFLPERFYFMSVWGVPVSSVQEQKITLNYAVDEDGNLVIKPLNNTVQVEDTHKRSLDQGEAEGESSTKYDSVVSPPAKKVSKVQSTLTTYFGATTKPEIRYPTALGRKGVHIFKEREIEEAKGTEKKRRIFWNEKASEICKNEKYNSIKPAEIDQLLHEKWRLHKAGLLEEEDRIVSNKIDKLLLDNPDIVSEMPSSRKVKSGTILKNLRRLEFAKKSVEKSRQSLDELQSKQCDQPKEKIRDKQERHRENYLELQKAEDALRQCLEVKKRFLSDVTEKLNFSEENL